MYIKDATYTRKEFLKNKNNIITKYGKNNIYKSYDYKGRIIFTCYVFTEK